LTGREWAQASLSVERYPDTRSKKQREHGAAFPLSLARQQIEIYSRRGEVVLDPFLGVGTTLDACRELGRRGIGIEINDRFARTARKDLGPPSKSAQRVIVGDAKRLSRWLRPASVDFMLTSPPYGALLKNVKGAFAYKWQEHSTLDAIPNPAPYSQLRGDLGNMNYADYLASLAGVLGALRSVLKPGAYSVWVLKDFRSLREGIPYVNLHGHFIDRAEAQGFTLWDIRIYDQTKFRPLVCLGYPSRNFYLNLGHSYLITLKNQ